MGPYGVPSVLEVSAKDSVVRIREIESLLAQNGDLQTGNDRPLIDPVIWICINCLEVFCKHLGRVSNR